MKTKFIALLLGAALCFSLTAAGCKNNTEPESSQQSQSDTSDSPKDSADPDDTPAQTDHKKEVADITATELFDQMTIGWNLGNTLDAVGNGLGSETAWGNPKATKELIDTVKAAGFDTVRIPVTWMGHFTEDTYEIDEEWLARVKEVVDYVLDNDMYAIINIHHDGNDTAQSWLTPVPSDEEAMVAQFETLWKQIAEYFNEYDEHLLFAGMNEFHHGYSNPTNEYLRITDELNQSFVTTVRATGGNNANRILICPAYNTNGDASLKMTMPEDTVSDKLMMEIHFYDPWDFAGSGKGDWGQTGTHTANWGQESWVDDIFGRIKAKFVDNGIPVIIGEYGAINNRDGYDDFRRYYVEYVTKAAKKNGLLPIWWDNGHDGPTGEAFSLFNRIAYTKLHEDIHEAIMRAASGEDYTIELPQHNEAAAA